MKHFALTKDSFHVAQLQIFFGCRKGNGDKTVEHFQFLGKSAGLCAEREQGKMLFTPSCALFVSKNIGEKIFFFAVDSAKRFFSIFSNRLLISSNNA